MTTSEHCKNGKCTYNLCRYSRVSRIRSLTTSKSDQISKHTYVNNKNLTPGWGGQFVPAVGVQLAPLRGWSFCSDLRWSFWPFFLHKWRTDMRSINGYRYCVGKHITLSGTKMVIVIGSGKKDCPIGGLLN